jgi:hypothetical protein
MVALKIIIDSNDSITMIDEPSVWRWEVAVILTCCVTTAKEILATDIL